MKTSSFNRHILEQINRLDSDFLRDLAYLLLSKNLKHPALEEVSFYEFKSSAEKLLPWLGNLKNTPSKEEFNLLPLGKYAEHLLKFYFERSEDHELLAFNLQLNQDGVTQGEADFLLKDSNLSSPVHLELALKYYLRVQQNETDVFLGPSTKDWFGRKASKLIKHQVPLLKENPHLIPKNLKEDYLSQVMIKGSLFIPLSEWEIKDLSEYGWWERYNHKAPYLNEDYQFKLVVNKKNWIYPFVPVNLLTSKETKGELEKYFKSGENELMLIRFSSDGTFIDRGFVVRSDWPD